MYQNFLQISVSNELDVVLAYKRAMQLSERLNMAQANQTKFATAVSEICRNVVEYVGSGAIRFSIANDRGVHYLEALVTDRGRGIGNLEDILASRNYSRSGRGSGIVNSRKLVDQFEIESSFEKGTKVMLRKQLPHVGPTITKAVLDNWMAEFEQDADISPYAEIKKQNMQLLEVLEQLRMRNMETEQQLQEIRRLNAQLQQSNQDINQLLEEREKKNRLLQEANRHLDAFAHTVSHDLRAPLQNINGLTAALESCLDTDHISEAQNMFPMLRQQTQKMDRLITGILAYSLAGHHNIRKAVVDLHPLLHQVITSLNVPSSFRIHIPDDLPILYTQEIYLHQVFSNIISNAIKYHDQPEQAVISVGCSLEQEWLYLSVEDNGPGIAKEVQQRIFNVYESGNSFARPNSTGLGLSIVRKIVEEKGGKVWVESEARGSRFVFTWPGKEVVQQDS
ncbi:phospho-acceptor domain-containing protein [Pontibacter ummariensis]|uniref:histidine kinase n=1 Tax=Pontibacter ummariensis TaxID=1610492 RepID=A0A239EVD9_9BACT|nr:sensor histidine kinase [Pontibacter ummariensis]PRY12751.1 phospho-acceptor domain-containing protein [Pontibacter ummariensis]SNS48013.1 His Kinase A (phospho-acceptor) domain-containing protein [Pontibacter ummariensis]